MKKISFLLFMALTGCGNPTLNNLSSSLVGTSATPLPPGGTEPATRIIFHADNFTSLDTFNPAVTNGTISTQFQCAGDLVKNFYVTGTDYSSPYGQMAFPIQPVADALSPTTHAGFLKNVSVDMTNTYYIDSNLNMVQSDRCSYRGVATAALPNFCSDFNRTPAGAPTPTITPAPSPAYTPAIQPFPSSADKFYRVFDDWCQYQGPIIDADIEMTKAHVGGVNIDLDRTQIYGNEDLLMNITYHSFNGAGATDEWPLNSSDTLGVNDHTVMNVQMVGTGANLSSLLGVKQPRAWADYNSEDAPVYAKDITTLEDPYGSIRTEQVLVPLSQYPLVDRIRIERIRGSFFLYQVDLYRLGSRTEQ